MAPSRGVAVVAALLVAVAPACSRGEAPACRTGQRGICTVGDGHRVDHGQPDPGLRRGSSSRGRFRLICKESGSLLNMGWSRCVIHVVIEMLDGSPGAHV